MIGIDSNIMLSYYQSLSGGAGSGAALTAAVATGTSNKGSKAVAPMAPWESKANAPRASELVKQALAGRSLINSGATIVSGQSATGDYGKLFTLYQGLNGLSGLAEQLQGKNATAYDKARIQTAFDKGQKEVSAYVDGLKLEKMTLSRGAASASSRTAVGVVRANEVYKTPTVHTGATADPVAAFQGDVQFDISVKGINTTKNLHINLAEMGATTRSMGEVVNFINGKLSAQGVVTRFDRVSTPAEVKTIQVAGKPVTLPAGQPTWSLVVKGDTSEKLTFSATERADAVYLAQTAGITTTDAKAKVKTVSQQELLKFQTDGLDTAIAPPDALQRRGEPNFVGGRVFASVLPPEVTAVRASQTAADGSVFMLAEIKGTVGEQTIKGTSDVALLKYDSVGHLVYTRTLGAAEKASGMAMSVSADGKVAIAGSVTGGLGGATAGADAVTSDSFVSVYNSSGEELWTQRRGTAGEDEARSVAFAADGSVYIAGRAKQAFRSNTSSGGWDAYIQGFDAAGTAKFATQFGTAGDDKANSLVVDGTAIVVGSNDNGHAVIRRFELQATGAPTLTSTRDLGDLDGGELTGIALDGTRLVAVGSTRNVSLSGATVASAAGGGMDAFAISLAPSLVPGTSDRIAFLGGAGDEKATAMTVSDGKVWIAGTSTDSFDSLDKLGTKDGFLTRFDIATGTQEWSRRFTAKEGSAVPSAITVAKGSASVLDRLGLPTGQLTYSDSTLLTSATSVRAGDQFRIRLAEGGTPRVITIDKGETLTTLAAKITQFAGYQAKVEVKRQGAYDRLTITAATSRSTIELLAGDSGKDALEALGLTEGLVRSAKYDVAARQYTYGLKLDHDLKLDSADSIKATIAELQTALSTVRTAYRSLATNLDPAEAVVESAKETAKKKTVTEVPAYMKAQLANYQAGLNRLTGGG